MVDAKKVIRGLEQCFMSPDSEEYETNCADCPYFDPDITVKECMQELRKDAISILIEKPTIIYCKNCKHYEPDEHDPGHGDCNGACDNLVKVHDGWFCPEGKWKDGAR